MTKDSTSEHLSEEEVLEELVAEEEAKLARQRGRGNVLWGLLGLFLLAVLAAQYVWFTQRDDVLQHEQMRPWLETVCEYAACQLPTTRALSQLHISKNYMDKHDSHKEAVLLHFIFVNQAHFPQPYPGVEIRFEDENNKVVGLRRLAPKDYLNAVEDELELSPHQPVHVNLELQNVVPNMHTFGYSIQFI